MFNALSTHFNAGKKVINYRKELKSSMGDEHNDDDEHLIKTSFQPWLLPSRSLWQVVCIYMTDLWDWSTTGECTIDPTRVLEIKLATYAG